MKFFKQIHYLLLPILLFSACKSSKLAQENTRTQAEQEALGLTEDAFSFTDSSDLVLIDEVEQEKPDLIASIERTACYGKCPVYEAKIFSNGLVLYEGKQHVENMGLFEAYILEDQINHLLAEADSIQFFDLAAAYPEKGQQIYDLPSTQLFIKKEDTEKTVLNNHNAPKTLRSYETYFDLFLNNLSWKKVEEEDASSSK
ncbi:MAG: DUF6438 domain-containing protein [Bacteroidota bacterium]